jgi:hypothetical protein
VYNEIRAQLYREVRAGNAGQDLKISRTTPSTQFTIKRYYGSAPEEYINAKQRTIDESLELTKNEEQCAKNKRVWKAKSNIKHFEEFEKEKRASKRGIGRGGGSVVVESNHNQPLAYMNADALFTEIKPDLESLSGCKSEYGEKKKDYPDWDPHSKRGQKSISNFRKFLDNSVSHLAAIQNYENTNHLI